jgi:RNA polymerase sigma factor (sigma-70 family)
VGSHRTSASIDGLLRIACARDIAGQTDGQLLERFLAERDEAAFATLVKRHGPMVLGVCRRILGNAADAEDAFQATFLVLVRRATFLKARPVLGDWLHGVARRTALNARRMAARRRMKEEAMARSEVQGEEVRDNRLSLLDEELSRLPEKYRLPIVLCDLEGWTRREAAERLQWPEGTVAGRLARGRELLAKRLVRYGLAVSAASAATAYVPPALASSTIRAATAIVAGQGVTSAISASVAALAEGAMRNMMLTKFRITAVVFIVVAVLGAGGTAGILAYRLQAEQPGINQQPTEPKEATPKVFERKAAIPAIAEKSYHIQPGDLLKIHATPTLPNFPIQGIFPVESNGQVVLGAPYGSVNIKGLTLEEASDKIRGHLGTIIANAIVSVTRAVIEPGDLLNIEVANVLPGRPIKGIVQVEPSGKVPLGIGYGRVEVKGLTLEEAEDRIQSYLRRILVNPKTLVTRPISMPGGTDPELELRVQQLEKEVHALRALIEELRKKPKP